MKKSTVTILLLLALPLAVVAVTFGSSGATMYDGETVQQISWFQTVPEAAYGWCLPVAAILNYIVFALAVVYGLGKKQWCLKGIFWFSFAALCLASLPIVAQTEIKIVPNVLGLLLLGAESLASHFVRKNPALASKNAEPQGKRLERH